MSNKRITIVIDEKLEKQLRIMQANLILKDGQSHSFSQVLNDTLKKVLQEHFEKEVVVLMYNDDIQFVGEGEIRDFIEKLENIVN